jgi:Zn-dependent protease with chaperone function
MRVLSRLLAALAALALVVQSAAAQSILRDAETEALLKDMAAPLIAAAGLEPRNVDIVLVNDPSVNAFVAGGQAVYINSGLINTADTANQVQGVIAHELGHVTGGHVVRMSEGASAATGITLLSLLRASGFAQSFCTALLRLGMPAPEAACLLSALLEVTGGCYDITSLGASFALLSFAIGWGGICVHFQILSSVSKIRVSRLRFTLFRLLHGVIAAVIANLFTPFLPKQRRYF